MSKTLSFRIPLCGPCQEVDLLEGFYASAAHPPLAPALNSIIGILHNLAFIIFCFDTQNLISVQSLKPTPFSQIEFEVWPILLRKMQPHGLFLAII